VAFGSSAIKRERDELRALLVLLSSSEHGASALLRALGVTCVSPVPARECRKARPLGGGLLHRSMEHRHQ
jgi:hypothetical protein